MAVRRKTNELPPTGAPVARPLTEERNRDREESERDAQDLQDRIMSHGLPATEVIPPDPDVISGNLGPNNKPDATPVGGNKLDPQPPQPPPPPPPSTTAVTPPPAVGAETTVVIPSDEAFKATLDKAAQFTPKNESDRQGISALRTFATKCHESAKAADQLAKDAEKRAKEAEAKVIPEPELARLRNIEKRFETGMVEQLPEWEEYDKAVAGIDSAAAAFLTQTGAIPEIEKVLGVINKRGGLSKFAANNQENSAGKAAPGMSEAQWFKANIFDKLDERQKIRLEQLLAEADAKRGEKQTKLAEKKTNAKATLEAEQQKGQAQLKEVWDATVKELNEEILPKFDLPTTKPMIAATDTPEEKKAKQEVIDIWETVEAGMQSPITTAKSLVQLRQKGAMFDPMMGRYIAVKKERDDYKTKYEESEARHDKIKDSKRLSRGTIPTPAGAIQKDQMQMTTEEALAAANFPVAGVNR